MLESLYTVQYIVEWGEEELDYMDIKVGCNQTLGGNCIHIEVGDTCTNLEDKVNDIAYKDYCNRSNRILATNLKIQDKYTLRVGF